MTSSPHNWSGSCPCLGCRLQRLLNSSSTLVRLRVEGRLSKDQDCRFQSRCLQLKHFVERYSKLPSATRATPQSVGYALATWINGLYSTGVLSNPYKRAMLQSVHPLVADRVAKWEQKTHRINLPKWEVMLATLVNYVTANGCLPQSASKSSDYLYEWFSRQLRRLAQLPGELLRQSHPLISAAVAARSPKRCSSTGLRSGVVIAAARKPDWPNYPCSHRSPRVFL